MTLPQPDAFDPNTWAALLAAQDAYEYRIYLDRNCFAYAIVDREDYEWAVQWCWVPVKFKRTGIMYARRNLGYWTKSQRYACYTLYLHVEIMKRVGPPPSPEHFMVDHINRSTLDCRRANLRWATHKMNNANSRRSRLNDVGLGLG